MLKLDYRNINISEIIDDYERLKRFFINEFQQSYPILEMRDVNIPAIFDILQGEILQTEAKILMTRKFPLILFEFTFEITKIIDLKLRINEILEEICNEFDKILESYINQSRGQFRIEVYLNWIEEKTPYYIFEITQETTEEEKEKCIEEIYEEIFLTNFPNEKFIKSHWIYGEFFELFCTKSFLLLFYRLSGTDLQERYIHSTRNSIRDFYILSELLINSIHLIALNSINQIFSSNSKNDLVELQYFNNIIEATRLLITNRELMSDPGEKVFGIISKLTALDRTLENAKLMISLRSERTNESLQNTIKDYTKKTNRLTFIILLLTGATIVACADDLFENIENLCVWIWNFISNFLRSIIHF
jgi:hypothetical protein